MKNKYTVLGIILTAAGLGFIAFALANPQLSFPWRNWVTYTLYGYYAAYTVLVFCMPKLKNASLLGCAVIALQFVALGLVTISIGTEYTAAYQKWYLPAGLFLSAVTQFITVRINTKLEEKRKAEEAASADKTV